MRDHELELIAALVEGRLEDESEARALVASSPEFREEYEMQKLAYEALRDSGTASLTETERAALHRDVWTELRADRPVATRRSPWYYRWMPVAAGLFVVVGLVGVVTQVGGGDDAAETANLAADVPEEFSTSTAEATDGTEAPSAEEEAEPMEDARTETTVAADGDAGADEGGETDETAFLFSTEADNARAGDFSGAGLQAYQDVTRSGDVENCLTQLGLADYEVVATLSTPVEEATSTTSRETDRLLVALPADSETDPVPVAFIDPGTCELVHLDQ